MSTRLETEARYTTLKQNLRNACRQNSIRSSRILPPVRELAAQHNLSVNLVCRALEELVEEGILQTVPRVGTFMRTSRPATNALFVMLCPEPSEKSEWVDLRDVQVGFEKRIAQRGGATLVLTSSMFFPMRTHLLSEVCGIFVTSSQCLEQPVYNLASDLPCVEWSLSGEYLTEHDSVAYDQVENGRIAARHFIDQGHRAIASLQVGCENSASLQRKQGWRAELCEAGLDPQRWDFQAEIYEAHKIAQCLLQREITAVVANSRFAALALLQVAEDEGVPPANWPAILHFASAADNRSDVASIFTTLCAADDALGAAAADLLWERHHGLIHGPSQHRKVTSRLIPRLTSRESWRLHAGELSLSAIGAR
jgi:DNA-binding LacI/PurR family transcriptional regulator